MEFQQVFVTASVILVGILGVFGLINFWNVSYGTNVGNTFNSTASHVQTITTSTLGAVSVQVGNSTDTPSGAGAVTTSANLVNRALSILTIIPSIIGLVPAMLQDAAGIMGVPQEYTLIAAWVFIFGFALLFAYLLIVGVRRLV
jgi:hypothetical protein